MYAYEAPKKTAAISLELKIAIKKKYNDKVTFLQATQFKKKK